jgi:hypothetical protein
MLALSQTQQNTSCVAREGALAMVGMVQRPADRFDEVRALVAAETVQTQGVGAIEAYLQALCCAAARALGPGGAVLHVMKGESPFGSLIASDEISKLITEQQVTLGEGPTLDVSTSRRPVLEPDLAGHGATRWPAFAPAALSLGACSVFAFPLQIGAARLGVLDINRPVSGSMTENDLALALTFAETAVVALLGVGRDLNGETDVIDGVLADEALLYQAQGMVMVQLSVRLEEAAARLRGHAYVSERRLAEVARDVVARLIQFQPDDTHNPELDRS